MKKVSILWAMLCVLSSCDPATDTQQSVKASAYAPGAAGDHYTYAESADFDGVRTPLDTITYRVTGEVTLGGQSYTQYLPDRDTLIVDGVITIRVLDTLYLRVAGSRISRWVDDSVLIYADFSSTQSQSLFNFSRDTSIVTTAGSFNNARLLKRNATLCLVREAYAPEVGLVYSDICGWELRLISAKVGGRSYP